MGAGHAHALYVHEHSGVHRLPAEVKIVAAFGFVFAVALTPPQEIWALALDAVALAVVIRLARLRPGFVATRLLAILPFVLFAFLIPFVASGERTEILGVAVSREGLWGMWNILAKATLGGTTSILLAATTELPDILKGMGRLRVPPVLTSIASFMIRYLELIAAELGRMRTAMTARGYDPRWLWQARPVAAAAGAMFVRSYERGERVYDAMLSRGYTGVMPDLDRATATPGDWVRGMALPLVAAVLALAGRILA